MKEMMAAMEALGNLKKFAKQGMFKKKKSLNEQMDTEPNAVPGGSASKMEEDPDEYGDSRLPENLQNMDVEDDNVTVVMMSGKKVPKIPKYMK